MASLYLPLLICQWGGRAYLREFCERASQERKEPRPTHCQPALAGCAWGGGGAHLQKVCRHSRSTTASPGASAE